LSALVDHSDLSMTATSSERKLKHSKWCCDLVTISCTTYGVWPLNAVCVAVGEIGCCEQGQMHIGCANSAG